MIAPPSCRQMYPAHTQTALNVLSFVHSCPIAAFDECKAVVLISREFCIDYILTNLRFLSNNLSDTMAEW